MSGRRIVGAMFICMAALFYLAKYVLFEIHYSGTSFAEDVNKFQFLEEVFAWRYVDQHPFSHHRFSLSFMG
nr:hypothetical protein [Bacillus pumilus]